MIIRRITLVLLTLLVGLLPIRPAVAQSEVPEIVGGAAILVDCFNGQILYEKEAYKRMYPASTTKILTAIIALENNQLSETVKVPREACLVGGSSIGLQEGELISLRDLMYALLLNSGNDAATAIAVHVGGSVSGFVEMMNQKAIELSAFSSNFKNPHGLSDEEHYTTAYDLYLIADYAMKHPVFREIVATDISEIQRTHPEAQTKLANSNKLLSRHSEVIGVKTGYTDMAGQCLVSAAIKQERELIAVVLASEGQLIYDDSMALLNYGFDRFSLQSLFEERDFVVSVPVKNGRLDKVDLMAGGSIYYYQPVDGTVTVEKRIDFTKPTIAPLHAGEKLGELIIIDGRREVSRVDLYCLTDVPKALIAYVPKALIVSWKYALGLVVFLVMVRVINGIRRAKRRQAFLRRRKMNNYVYSHIK